MFSLISIPGLIALLLALLGGLLLWLGRRQAAAQRPAGGHGALPGHGRVAGDGATATQPPLRAGGAPRLSGADARPEARASSSLWRSRAADARPNLTPATSCNWRHTVCWSRIISTLRPLTVCCATQTPRYKSPTQMNCAAGCWIRPARSGRRDGHRRCAAATVNHGAARAAVIAPRAGRRLLLSSF